MWCATTSSVIIAKNQVSHSLKMTVICILLVDEKDCDVKVTRVERERKVGD